MAYHQPDHSGLQSAIVEQQPNAPPQTFHTPQHYSQQQSHLPELAQHGPNYAYALPSPSSTDAYRHQQAQFAQELAQPPNRVELPPLEHVSVLPTKPDGSSPISHPRDKPFEVEGTEPPKPPRKYCCGLSLKWLLIIIGVTVLVVAGAVGGAVGGILSRKSSSDSGSGTGSDTSRPGSNSNSANSSLADLQPGDRFRTIAATSCDIGNGTNTLPENTVLFFQASNGTIWYNQSPERLSGNWDGWNDVGLQDSDVQMNTPLTVRCWPTESSQYNIQLTYLRPRDSALTTASAICNGDGSSCSWSSPVSNTSLILPNTTQFVASQSANASSDPNSESTTYNTYLYEIRDNIIGVLSNDTRTGNTYAPPEEFQCGDNCPLAENTYIAATSESPNTTSSGGFASEPDVYAYWFDKSGQFRRTNGLGATSIAYISSRERGIAPEVPIVPVSAMAAYYDYATQSSKIYWLLEDGPMEFTTPWSDESGAIPTYLPDDAWEKPDGRVGPVAASGGYSPPRLFYVVGGEIREYIKSGSTWRQGSLDGGRYD